MSGHHHHRRNNTTASFGNAVGGLVANGKDFAHEDGSPHFLIGIELDWLWALELDAAAGVKTAPLEGFIRHITSFGFNHALVNTFANWSNCASSTPRLCRSC